MSEMIERVARAMAANDSGPQGSALFDIHWNEFGYGYRESALVAIQAMMEPDLAMIKAFVSTALDSKTIGDYGWQAYAKEQWQAMLTAALNPSD